MRLNSAGYRVSTVGLRRGRAGPARHRAAPAGAERRATAGPRRPGAVRRDPPPPSLVAGDPAHCPRHHPRRGGGHRTRRVHLPHQAVRRQGAAREDRAGPGARRRRRPSRRMPTSAGARDIISRSAAWPTCWPRPRWSPRPTPACCCAAKAAAGKEMLAQAIHGPARAPTNPSSRSTAAPSPRPCSSPNCSAT